MNEVYKNVGELNKTKKELINKLKQLENERERFVSMNNDLNNFVHAVSHDLRSPISHLKGLIDILSISIPNSPATIELVTMINSSLNNLKDRIDDLSVLSSAEEQEGFNFQHFTQIMQEVKFDLQDQITFSKAKIIEDFSKAPSINFSKKNLRSILFNLTSNAIKYRSPHRTPVIKISTERLNSKRILLKVADNGMGIKEEDKFKVFLMYKRLVDNVEGKGIGLALVKRIIDNAGGRIELESEFGTGCCFKIYLRT